MKEKKQEHVYVAMRTKKEIPLGISFSYVIYVFVNGSVLESLGVPHGNNIPLLFRDFSCCVIIFCEGIDGVGKV